MRDSKAGTSSLRIERHLCKLLNLQVQDALRLKQVRLQQLVQEESFQQVLVYSSVSAWCIPAMHHPSCVTQSPAPLCEDTSQVQAAQQRDAITQLELDKRRLEIEAYQEAYDNIVHDIGQQLFLSACSLHAQLPLLHMQACTTVCACDSRHISDCQM